MQEEVEQKSLTLTVNAAKMTARLFRAAIAKYVAHKKEKKHDAQTGVRYVGRQSVKKLVGQNQGVSNVELSGEDIKAFERVARKYGVDYALKKDMTGEKPRYLVFFKAKDKDQLQPAFKEFTAMTLDREKRPTIRERLAQAQEQTKTKHREREKVKTKDREVAR